MGNLASGHFKPTNNIQEQHNDRTLSPSYLLPEEFRGKNEVNRHSKQAMILKNQIIENAHETYLITFKQKLKSKSYQWSLVVNIKTDTTMSDLEKLAEHFEIKYGFQCYQIAIHRDEGYIDENNQPHTNHHAHMEFITLNKENGKNMWRQINQIKLRQIQTEIAQILGMERGTDKRVSGTERIEPRKYAQMKNQERKKLEAKEKELNTLKQDKTNLTNKLQDKDKTINELQERPTTEQYSQLERANSEQAQTIQEKDKKIATLNTLNAKLEKTNKDLLNITKQYPLLDLIYDNPTDEKTEKKPKTTSIYKYSPSFGTLSTYYSKS
ncbi:mobilization protein [Helicobacter pylori]|uniref:mobilization protein n=1 Tax=Helicobacter pylori TaxID=210 RepID=UPI001FBBEF01|nr:mobilization protein [Helicobacter pylori]